MNFEEWLKQGLNDSPGGELDESKIDEVLNQERTSRTSGPRRWVGTVRNTGIVAAAVVVAAGVIGTVLWSGKHQLTTAKNQGDDSLAGNTVNAVVSQQNATSQNQVANSVASTDPKTPSTNKLQMFALGTLTADHYIAWPGVQQNPIASSTIAQVVQVPFTSSVSTPTLTAPKTIPTSLPVQVEGKLVAYFVQMTATTSFYLLGPPGMTGKAELAADGSFDVYLHSAHASIELDTPGASPVTAESMAAPFFAAARKAAAGDVPGGKFAPLGNATVFKQNPNTAYFAFASKSGQNVAGWNAYLPQSGQGAARMIYESDSSDWSYAPYVLEGSVNLLNNVLAPELHTVSAPTNYDKVVQPTSATVKLGSQSVTLPDSDGHAVQSPDGVAWLLQPPIAMKGSSESPWSRVATESYNIALGTPKGGRVAETDVQLKQTIPSLKVVDGDNNVFYAYPHMGSLTGGRWLLYTVTWALPGMNQPYANDLHVYDMKTGHDMLITTFADAGGMFFSLGTSGKYLAYDKSGITGAQGNTLHKVYVVNLLTGKQTKLATSNLIKSKSTSGESVKFTEGGSTIVIPLSQG